MAPAEVSLTTRRPEPPAADFAFYIDFKKGIGPASRVFSATHDFVKACERLDRELVTSIDANIETVMVLEDIEAASLKTWLRSSLRATDDQALKDLDWRPQVGKYLVRAKYAVLRWIDNRDSPKDLPALGREIQALAAETDVRHLPDYTPISPNALIAAVKDFQGVKDHLVEGDKASIIAPSGEQVDFNLSFRIDVENIEELAVRETQVHSVPSMVLIVRKPDYLGTSMWDLRHGRKPISARVEDDRWLGEFQGRRIDVRPGDALKCKVRIEMAYGHDNELIREKYFVEEVQSVLENQYQQSSFLEDRSQ
ncbi:MAG: hypothetical protein WD270_11945 [Acetobacterales bacterium]